ncbi:MAG: HAD-IA family hydrolase [Clostridia bacterium]|nr:HAD-IA family hydrolase [Clostridia bacterium]
MNTYLFDFDGTLVDSMPTYADMMMGILEEEKATYGADILKIVTPLGYALTAKYFVEHCGAKSTEEALVATMNARALDAYTNRIPAKAHVPEVLQELARRGCSLNVLTASPHTMLDPCLKRLGLFDLFDNVWSCEDFGTGKSDPAIYHAAAEKIGKPVGEIIFLDDNPGACKTAKKAGMCVYGVYDDSSREYVDEMKAATDRYIYNFKELL